MISELKKVEDARQEAMQLLGEGYAQSLPLLVTLTAISQMLRNRNIPRPEDCLAWVSQGKVSDAMIQNLYSVTGR